tara:strand:+ start:205 stop:411 length:207 start_codon:yes stop_codon:yes gene_type:complete
MKKLKEFSNLDEFPDLKQAVVPSLKTLPVGTINTKIIVNEGEIIERVFQTPRGEVISLFTNQTENKAS